MKRNARFAETRETGCDFGVLGASVAKGGGGSLPRTHAPDPLAVQVLNGLTGAQEVSMGGKASRSAPATKVKAGLPFFPRKTVRGGGALMIAKTLPSCSW